MRLFKPTLITILIWALVPSFCSAKFWNKKETPKENAGISPELKKKMQEKYAREHPRKQPGIIKKKHIQKVPFGVKA